METKILNVSRSLAIVFRSEFLLKIQSVEAIQADCLIVSPDPLKVELSNGIY
ncbi:hypothetical protein [Thalassoglobus sp.]|uniref:hypothetical protein n=1 Tax=Thalassoglobus sp. TaxID=2795869 RepID=UPI003AA7D2EF